MKKSFEMLERGEFVTECFLNVGSPINPVFRYISRANFLLLYKYHATFSLNISIDVNTWQVNTI